MSAPRSSPRSRSRSPKHDDGGGGRSRSRQGKERSGREENRGMGRPPSEGLTEDKHDKFLTARRERIKPVVAKTEAQADYIAAIRSNVITIGVGPAGTGKTYIAGALAANALLEGEVDSIIITRPAVEAGEHMGFLPGTIDEKFEPYLAPFRDVLVERLGAGFVDYLIKSKKIDARPMAYLRGTTFRRAFVILDEAQNTTPVQMKLFLTRIGEDSKVVVDGDGRQSDINISTSGLADAITRLHDVDGIEVVTFSVDDVVRSGIVQDIIRKYE